MLNPFASDFKPFTPELKTPAPIPTKPESQTKKKPPAKKNSAQQQQQSTKTKKPTVKAEVQSHAESSNTSHRKNKESQQSGPNKKNTSQDAKSRNRRKSSQKDIAAATSTAPPSVVEDQFSKESPFIAIEAAIDPVHRLDKRNLPVNVNYSRRASSAQEPRFEHGYERYIDWIDRSLKIFDTVTVVGMDKAIVDVVSMVTILHDRKIGAHDDIETFSMNPGTGKMTSCIQVKLHPYY